MPHELGEGHRRLDGSGIVHIFKEPALRPGDVASQLLDLLIHGRGVRRRNRLRGRANRRRGHRGRRCGSRRGCGGRGCRGQPHGCSLSDSRFHDLRDTAADGARSRMVSADHGLDVDDEGNLAVAEDRRANEAFDLAVVAAEALDDDLSRAVDRIHFETDFPSLEINNDNRPSGTRFLHHVVPVGERAGEVHQREDLVAQHDDAVGADGPQDRVVRLHDLPDGGHGNGIRRSCRVHEDRGDDGHRQGQGDRDRGAGPRRGSHAQVSVHVVHGSFHRVHADAASRDVGDLPGGAEAGQEDEAEDLFGARPGGLVAADQAFLQRLAEDGVTVEAPPVVGNLDADVVAVLVGAEPDGARLGLSRRGPLGGRLEAVIHSVANQVHEGLADAVDHLLVDFRFFSEDVENDRLAICLGQVAYHAPEAVEHVGDREHPRLHDAVLQVARDCRQGFGLLLQVVDVLRLAVLLPQLLRGGDKAGIVDHQLSDKVQQCVQLLHGHAHDLVGAGPLRQLGRRLVRPVAGAFARGRGGRLHGSGGRGRWCGRDGNLVDGDGGAQPGSIHRRGDGHGVDERLRGVAQDIGRRIHARDGAHPVQPCLHEARAEIGFSILALDADDQRAGARRTGGFHRRRLRALGSIRRSLKRSRGSGRGGSRFLPRRTRRFLRRRTRRILP